jgi:hypothetical protein
MAPSLVLPDVSVNFTPPPYNLRPVPNRRRVYAEQVRAATPERPVVRDRSPPPGISEIDAFRFVMAGLSPAYPPIEYSPASPLPRPTHDLAETIRNANNARRLSEAANELDKDIKETFAIIDEFAALTEEARQMDMVVKEAEGTKYIDEAYELALRLAAENRARREEKMKNKE